MSTVLNGAAQRVEMSRERLRLAMRPPRPDPAGAHAAEDAGWLRWKSVPVLRDIAESIAAWWGHHPLRPLTRVAGEASGAIARPLAQRHPIVLVAAAAGLGAALAWGRPWRWLFRSALFAGLAPQIATRLAASLPLESWMTLVGDAFSRPRTPTASVEPEPVVPRAEPNPA